MTSSPSHSLLKALYRSSKNTKNRALRTTLMTHLQEICADAEDWPWEWVRDYHATVLTRMEGGYLTWESREEIQQVRNRGLVARSARERAASKPQYQSREVSICQPFSQGRCNQKGDHKGLRHICQFCWSTHGNAYPHSEAVCNKRKARSFNDKSSDKKQQSKN